MRDPNNPCLFCNTSSEEHIFENDLAFATFDSYPVTKFHVLIIPKRHIKNYFELSNNELEACNKILILSKKKIEKNDKSIKGFNIGTNCGKSAGQSINHCHIHLIPRRKGDVGDPRGGVRGVIPEKQKYKI